MKIIIITLCLCLAMNSALLLNKEAVADKKQINAPDAQNVLAHMGVSPIYL